MKLVLVPIFIIFNVFIFKLIKERFFIRPGGKKSN